MSADEREEEKRHSPITPVTNDDNWHRPVLSKAQMQVKNNRSERRKCRLRETQILSFFSTPWKSPSAKPGREF
ncbi:hypothetical protein SUGI_0803890 [Cryptomeria japonica]|nr:hypothetical protein SUGI_0803890 [Cryptomeria japonica]